MTAPRTAIVQAPIDVGRLIAEVTHPSAGAVTSFVGTVRAENLGRAVTGIEYAAYAGMAERELEVIAGEAAAEFAPLRVVVEHRVGTLRVGEVSVAVVCAHAHRGPALDAVRYIIEELKRRVPVWKREMYVDGAREWVDPTDAAVAS
jgi:molybdopterin synthase catalytic subunit